VRLLSSVDERRTLTERAWRPWPTWASWPFSS